MFSLICASTKGWVNNRDAGDLRRHRAHYDVILILFTKHEVLPSDLAKSRSREIWFMACPIALKSDMRLGSSAAEAETSVKFQKIRVMSTLTNCNIVICRIWCTEGDRNLCLIGKNMFLDKPVLILGIKQFCRPNNWLQMLRCILPHKQGCKNHTSYDV